MECSPASSAPPFPFRRQRSSSGGGAGTSWSARPCSVWGSRAGATIEVCRRGRGRKKKNGLGGRGQSESHSWSSWLGCPALTDASRVQTWRGGTSVGILRAGEEPSTNGRALRARLWGSEARQSEVWRSHASRGTHADPRARLACPADSSRPYPSSRAPRGRSGRGCEWTKRARAWARRARFWGDREGSSARALE